MCNPYYRIIGLAHLLHSWLPHQPLERHLVVTLVHYWPPGGIHMAGVMPMIALHIYYHVLLHEMRLLFWWYVLYTDVLNRTTLLSKRIVVRFLRINTGKLEGLYYQVSKQNCSICWCDVEGFAVILIFDLASGFESH